MLLIGGVTPLSTQSPRCRYFTSMGSCSDMVRALRQKRSRPSVREAAVAPQLRDRKFNQLCRPVKEPGGERMLYRLASITVPLKPIAGAPAA